jgi:hypothetical protein
VSLYGYQVRPESQTAQSATQFVLEIRQFAAAFVDRSHDEVFEHLHIAGRIRLI